MFLLVIADVYGQEKFELEVSEIEDSVISLYEKNKVFSDSLSLVKYLKNTKNNLLADGYWAVSIDSVIFNNKKVKAYLYKGEKYSFANIDYSKLDSWALNELQTLINRKKHFNPKYIKAIQSDVLRIYQNNGYPFASVYIDSSGFDNKTLSLKITVDKGERLSVDSLIIKGDVKITENFILKTIGIKKGDKFNQEIIEGIDKQISNIPFMDMIKPTEIEFTEKGADLYIYLKKRKSNTFNGIIGFLPENEESDKLLITGELNLNLLNSFGRGEEILLNWEKLESSSQKLDLGFSYPYIFKSNLGFDFDFNLFKKDTSYINLTTGIGIRLFINYSDYVKLYYRYKSSSLIGEESQALINSNFSDTRASLFGIKYVVNKTDYWLNPRKGYKLDLFAEAGFKTADIPESETKKKLESVELASGLDMHIYIPIYKNFVFHFGNTTRYMDQFSDSNTLFYENELFKFGGAKSLRGFDESIFLASVYSLQNVEIKYLFEQNSSFYAFWNGAYYYKNVFDGVTEDFPWGFGVGIDFDTRAGIFSLSYALGKQFDNPFEIQSAKIHFGYISRF